jgi:hypothetical protein
VFFPPKELKCHFQHRLHNSSNSLTSTMESIKNDENELPNNTQNTNSSLLNHLMIQTQNIQDPRNNRNSVSGPAIIFPNIVQNQTPNLSIPIDHVQGSQILTLSSVNQTSMMQEPQGMIEAQQYQAMMNVVQLNQMTFQNAPLIYRLGESHQYRFPSLQNQHSLGIMLNPQINRNTIMGIKSETSSAPSSDYNVNQVITFDQNQAPVACFPFEATELFNSQIATQKFPFFDPVQNIVNSSCQIEKNISMAANPSDSFGTIEPFPERLHRLLSETAKKGLDDIVSFNSDGTAFQIHKPDRFFNEIMPNYFRQSRLSSFKRQLNLYGFDLISIGPLRGSYRHEQFLREKPELCRLMRRRDTKLKISTCNDQKRSSNK